MARKALIIATATYEDPGIPDLNAPIGDASELGRVLGDKEIGNFSVETEVDKPEHLLRRRVGSFLRDAGPGDILILYFACHGITDEEGKLYFAAADTEESHPEDTALPAEFVARAIARSQSEQIVLFLDCCYSARFFDGLLSRGEDRVHINEQLASAGEKGKIVIAASDRLQPSYEDLDQSLFSKAFVQGLETGDADANNDGLISVDELYQYLRWALRANGPRQQPRMWNDIFGPLYIARNPHRAGVGASLGGEAWPSLEPLPPSMEGALTTLVSEIATEVEFVNERNESVLIYWLDWEGHRILYQRLPPGHFYRQRTFVTHPWIACTADGEAIVAFQPTPAPGRAVIE